MGICWYEKPFQLIDDAHAAGYHDILTNVQLKMLKKVRKVLLVISWNFNFTISFSMILKVEKVKMA